MGNIPIAIAGGNRSGFQKGKEWEPGKPGVEAKCNTVSA